MSALTHLPKPVLGPSSELCTMYRQTHQALTLNSIEQQLPPKHDHQPNRQLSSGKGKLCSTCCPSKFQAPSNGVRHAP